MKHLLVGKGTLSWLYLVALLIIPLTLNTLVAAAGSASFSFEPAGGEIQQGIFTVAVYTNSGSDEVTYAQADINYDTSKFEFTSFNSTGSAYSAVVTETGGGGSISVGRFVSPAGSSVSGKKLLTKLNFKTIALGSGQIQLQNSSAILSKEDGSNIWNGSLTAAGYTIVAPSTPIPTPTPTPEPDSTTDPTDTGDDGTEPQTTVEQQQSNPDTPTPVNTNAANGVKKYLVAIKLKDKNGAVLADTNVRLGEGEESQSAKTDSTGVAGFVGVAPGTYDLFIETADGEIRRSISISEDSEDGGNLQEFTVDLSQEPAVDNPILFVLGGIVVAAALVGIGYLVVRGREGAGGISLRFKRSAPSQPPPTVDDTTEALNRIHTDIPSPDTIITPNNKDQ